MGNAKLACRLRGCNWRYRNEGRLVVQECSRRCGSEHRGALRRRSDASRLVRYLSAAARTRQTRWSAPWRWLVDGSAA